MDVVAGVRQTKMTDTTREQSWLVQGVTRTLLRHVTAQGYIVSVHRLSGSLLQPIAAVEMHAVGHGHQYIATVEGDGEDADYLAAVELARGVGIDLEEGDVERCANCEQMIGNLETPNIFRDQVVCAECHKRLSESVDAPLEEIEPNIQDLVDAIPPEPATPTILFRREGVIVTPFEIATAEGYLDLSNIYALKPERHLLGGVTVYAIDLARSHYPYKFSDVQTATEFMSAIVQAKGTVNIEQDQLGLGFWF